MKLVKTKFKGLIIFEGIRYKDNRGFFRELMKQKYFFKKKMIFWCMSKSKKNVLRGMHLQTKNQQEKFITVVKGKILDVVVDLRIKSKTFGKHFKILLSEKNCKSILIPKGFAHGFLALDKENIIVYGNSNYRSKKSELGIIWNDQDLNVKWPKKKFIISKKDKKNISLKKFITKRISL